MHPQQRAQRSLLGALCAVLLAGLVACAGPGGTRGVAGGPGGQGAAGSEPGKEAAPSPLAAESVWLKSLFQGTPVAVTDEVDGAVLVSVPLTYAFDSNAALAKPPIKAVLDKLALSLQRRPAARLQLAAPGPMVAQRDAALRRQLAHAGVGAWRLSTLASGRDDAVQLRLLPGLTARRQLDDGPAGAQPASR